MRNISEILLLTNEQKRKILAEQKATKIASGEYELDPELVFQIADTIAVSPEDFTDLTGKKLGMQRI